MSPCLTGGGRAIRLDLEIIKSPSTSWASNSSSPSSTLSKSSNSPLQISTRKPRTPRKRPNQTYNEAAAILSTAYPKIFPTKHLIKPGKFTKSYENANTKSHPLLFEPSELFVPFQVIDTAGYLLHRPILERPHFPISPKFEKLCQSPGEITSGGNVSEICNEYQEDQDFEAGSILDEEIEEGIDSIMGNLSVETVCSDDLSSNNNFSSMMQTSNNFCYGYPVSLGFDFEYGMRREVRAIRNVDEGDWWRFPCVNVAGITPKIVKVGLEKKKKKKVEIKKLEDTTTSQESLASKSATEKSVPHPNAASLLLKLNYNGVLNAWSDKGSPFSGDAPVSESAGNGVQIDLFSDNGGVREATVLRYKEKKRTRLFSKNITSQLGKVNADRRPRTKVHCVYEVQGDSYERQTPTVLNTNDKKKCTSFC